VTSEVASKKKLVFLPDHNIEAEIVSYLKSLRKVSVVSFAEVNLSQSADDPQVIEVATKEELLILTGDKRFTEKYIPMCRHQGIVKFDVGKPTTRLRCLKGFLGLRERHLVWKGVAHLHEASVMLQQHNGDQTTIQY
jgi:predicted nuclease of predicted toxin-antitoxin system